MQNIRPEAELIYRQKEQQKLVSKENSTTATYQDNCNSKDLTRSEINQGGYILRGTNEKVISAEAD